MGDIGVVPLDRDAILDALRAVADRLPPGGPQHQVVMVGGATLALHGLRDTTEDVDSIRRLDPELTTAAALIGRERGFRIDWLNDSPAMFLPQSFDESTCQVVLDLPRLLVLAAPPRQVFVMKMLAARAVDRPDLVRLWPLCGFHSPQEAVDDYWAAYPSAPEDEFLVDWVARIAREADS